MRMIRQNKIEEEEEEEEMEEDDEMKSRVNERRPGMYKNDVSRTECCRQCVLQAVCEGKQFTG